MKDNLLLPVMGKERQLTGNWMSEFLETEKCTVYVYKILCIKNIQSYIRDLNRQLPSKVRKR